MRKLSTIHILCLVLSALMLLALIPFPYGYYVLVRFVAMVVFGYMAFSFFNEQKIGYAIFAGVLALLFQPFIKVALGREMWQVVDVIVGISLIIFVLTDKNNALEKGHQDIIKASPNQDHINIRNTYDVFISYAVKDYFSPNGEIIPYNVISQIQTAFDGAGITYWIDKQKLKGGTVFPAEIAKQIQNAKVFLFVSSANSNDSMWTMNEIATANTYGKVIIPFRADCTPYCPEIMIYVAGLHYIDYLPNPTGAIHQLVDAIKSYT